MHINTVSYTYTIIHLYPYMSTQKQIFLNFRNETRANLLYNNEILLKVHIHIIKHLFRGAFGAQRRAYCFNGRTDKVTCEEISFRA